MGQEPGIGVSKSIRGKTHMFRTNPFIQSAATMSAIRESRREASRSISAGSARVREPEALASRKGRSTTTVRPSVT
jgi:hypothetical protein